MLFKPGTLLSGHPLEPACRSCACLRSATLLGWADHNINGEPGDLAAQVNSCFLLELHMGLHIAGVFCLSLLSSFQQTRRSWCSWHNKSGSCKNDGTLTHHSVLLAHEMLFRLQTIFLFQDILISGWVTAHIRQAVAATTQTASHSLYVHCQAHSSWEA